MAPTGAAPPVGAVIFDRRWIGAGIAVEQRLVPGMVDLVTRLHGGRVPIGLVVPGPDLAGDPGLSAIPDLADVVVISTPVVATETVGRDTGESAAGSALVQAARRLQVPPSRTAVVTITAASARAARHSGFKLMVGIGEAAQRAELEAAGAGHGAGRCRVAGPGSGAERSVDAGV